MINLVILYIDPGTGSLLISAIIGLALTFLFALKGFFYKIVFRLTGKTRHLKNDFAERLVFFNEGQRYWNVFEPVLKELIDKKQSFVYLSADKNDEGLKLNNEFCEAYYLGGINQAVILLNRLKAEMCVMTTPQLGILTLKRSEQVKHYCNLLHSPVDIHFYKKFAFDRFDSVLCVNSFQIKNLRQLENDRGDKKKELFETGCTYYDTITEIEEKKGEGILIAPSWGDKSFVTTYGKQLIKSILEAGYKVIFRPHPQSFTADKEALDEITTVFETEANFQLDRSSDNKQALSNSKIVITSMSGLVFDSTIGHKKPTIVVDINWDTRGWEFHSIKNTSSTHLLLKEVGKTISEDEIDDVVSIIKEVESMEIKDEIVDKYIFNFRNAGKVAAEQISLIFNK